MQAHTPGPWTNDYRDFSVVSESGKCVATAVQWYSNESKYSEEEMIANMDVISAAPEMLQALMACRDRLAEQGADHHAVALATAAIKKALGEQ